MDLNQLFTLNWIDYIIIIIIILSLVVGVIRGFVREVLSLLVWVTAFWISFKYVNVLDQFLSAYIQIPLLRFIASLAILFIGVLVVGAILGYLFSALINKSGLSSFDRLLGMIFGVARGMLLVIVVVMIGRAAEMQEEIWWVESRLIPMYLDLGQSLLGQLPEQWKEASNEIVDTVFGNSEGSV